MKSKNKMSTTQQKQTPKFCCQHFSNLIKYHVIITKEEAFPNHSKWKDQEYFKKHPKYIMWVSDNEPVEKNGYHWFHFCNNCGHQYSTDEQLEYWNKYWKI